MNSMIFFASNSWKWKSLVGSHFFHGVDWLQPGLWRNGSWWCWEVSWIFMWFLGVERSIVMKLFGWQIPDFSSAKNALERSDNSDLCWPSGGRNCNQKIPKRAPVLEGWHLFATKKPIDWGLQTDGWMDGWMEPIVNTGINDRPVV